MKVKGDGGWSDGLGWPVKEEEIRNLIPINKDNQPMPQVPLILFNQNSFQGNISLILK